VAHGSRNRGNPDLAVAIIEAVDLALRFLVLRILALKVLALKVLALGVLAQLRRPGRVHCRNLQSVLGLSSCPYLVNDLGQIARQLVSYRDFWRGAAAFAPIPAIYQPLW
jgi:hypothetical protein